MSDDQDAGKPLQATENGYKQVDEIIQLHATVNSPSMDSELDTDTVSTGRDSGQTLPAEAKEGAPYGIRRSSKDEDKEMQKQAKYQNRPSPPYKANKYCGKTMEGNDGNMYKAVKNSKGICQWKKI